MRTIRQPDISTEASSQPAPGRNRDAHGHALEPQRLHLQPAGRVVQATPRGDVFRALGLELVARLVVARRR